MSLLATTSGVTGSDVRDLMVAALEHRIGGVNRVPASIEWGFKNGDCYIAGETRSVANLGWGCPARLPNANFKLAYHKPRE